MRTTPLTKAARPVQEDGPVDVVLEVMMRPSLPETGEVMVFVVRTAYARLPQRASGTVSGSAAARSATTASKPAASNVSATRRTAADATELAWSGWCQM